MASNDVNKLLNGHGEISRLTFKRNVEKCLKIHSDDPTETLKCLNHNTDKIERRFFGYYQQEK